LALALIALATAVAETPALAQDSNGDAPTFNTKLLEPFKFRFIGPANPSGRVTAIAVPETPGRKTIYVGLASGGLWKTTNAGTTWKPVFDDQGTSTIGDVAVAPYDPKEIWVGTGERNSLRSNAWGDGVYKSTDGGKTWKNVGLKQTREIGRIAIHPTDSGTVYIAALGHLWGPNPERGIYKTTDGGETWERILFVDDTTGFVDLKMDPSNPDVLYAAAWHRLRWGGGRMEGAGAGSGIFKTSDGGRTWKKLTDPALDNGLPTRKLGRIGLAIYPKNPKIVYAVIQVAHGSKEPGVSPYGGLFRSEDGGESWQRVNDLSAVPDYYYNEVWVDPNDDKQIWLAATLLGRSSDGGATIEQLRIDRVHVDHHAMWVDPDDSQHMILGNDGGVYISYDGGVTWAHQIIPASQFYEVDVDTTKTPYHVCAGAQDNGTWCGPSRTREQVGITDFDWYRVFGGDGYDHAVSPDSPQIRYGESQFGNISRFNVETWKFESVKPHAEDAGAESGYAFRWDWNTPFEISQHDPTVVYLGGNYLFKLTDRGRDWQILGPDMTRANRFNPEPDSGHTSYHSLHSVAESSLDARVLWTGSNDGLLWVTTDGGRSWRNVTDNIPDEPPKRCWVSEIEPSHFDAGTAYVTYDCHRRDDYHPYVFKTTDGGDSWTNITGDLPEDGSSYVIREDDTNPNLLFVGTEFGLWISNKGGGQWVRLKNNLPTAAIRDMELVPRRKELVVATYGRSIYILDIGPLQELDDSVLAKDGYLFKVKPARLYKRRNTYAAFGDQFFRTPNPPYGTVITYYLKEDQGRDVTLTIRKASEEEEGAGKAVKKLKGSGRPGIHQLTWDLTAEKPRPRELGGPTSPQELRRILPGTYTVSLKVGDQKLERLIVVEEGWLERLPGRIR
jgi:photosystem II stability/assembly factor-like uncharacterized protein